MLLQEELTHSPALDAATYRDLWLDSEHRLGIIAETLADVLGWQPSEGDWLPDAETLASFAAARIVALEAQISAGQITHQWNLHERIHRKPSGVDSTSEGRTDHSVSYAGFSNVNARNRSPYRHDLYGGEIYDGNAFACVAD